MNKTFLIAVILSLITSVASAHKFPLEQGVQDSETLRLEIIENVVNPCYVNIAWSTGVEATMKLGEDAVLAKLKLDGHDEIETTVRSITRTVQGLPHPSSRMAIYMHSVAKCVAGASGDQIGEAVERDSAVTQRPDDWAEDEIIDNVYRACADAFIAKYQPDANEKQRRGLIDGLIEIHSPAINKIAGLIQTKYAATSFEERKAAYAGPRAACERQLGDAMENRRRR